ncbi:MAG: TfoX/Sxy family DNA transformation protein [Blastocatellia bacterium]
MPEEKAKSDGIKNIGPVSMQWRRAVGVHSLADLERTGSLETFRLIRAHGFNASLNLLYALEAALLDCHWTALTPDVKARLKAAAKKS